MWSVGRLEESHQGQVETLTNTPYWKTSGQKPGSGLSSSPLLVGLGLYARESLAARHLPVFLLYGNVWVNRGCQRILLPCCWEGC
jgi:hypothetical protein